MSGILVKEHLVPNRFVVSCGLLVTLTAATTIALFDAGAQKDGSTPAITEQAPDQWRASKLIGVEVFDRVGEKIGLISEVLVDHNGHSQVAVISMGGFFGIGRKDVALPFDTVKWVSHEAMQRQSNDASRIGIFKLLSGNQATDASKGYPAYAIIGLTKAQVKSSPDFKYSRPVRRSTPVEPKYGGPAADF
jgi:sporulation protein YlmC with PRC-barrel domain